MDDLTEYVEEIYPEGGVDGGKVTGADGAKVVGMLVDARNVLTYLMMMLDGKSERVRVEDWKGGICKSMVTRQNLT